MLLAEFFLAVAPAADGDAGRDARVDARRVHRHGGAEAETHHGDPVGLDFRSAGEKRHRAFGVLDLLQADDLAAHAFAVAAAAHVETQRDIAE